MADWNAQGQGLVPINDEDAADNLKPNAPWHHGFL